MMIIQHEWEESHKWYAATGEGVLMVCGYGEVFGEIFVQGN